MSENKSIKTANEFNSLMEVVDEAFDLVDNRITKLLWYPVHRKSDHEYIERMDFLKYLREVLRIAEKFRND